MPPARVLTVCKLADLLMAAIGVRLLRAARGRASPNCGACSRSFVRLSVGAPTVRSAAFKSLSVPRPRWNHPAHADHPPRHPRRRATRRTDLCRLVERRLRRPDAAHRSQRRPHRPLDRNPCRRQLVGRRDRQHTAGLVGIGPSRDPIDPNLGELDTIAVDPAYWRQGVGKALMQKALQALASTYPEAILWTLANYPQGQHFYESTGWTLDGGSRDNGHQISYRRRF
ncbi:GNAT family N-acetyltransferase [Kribbella sp. CA-245084]|uniref:GNAT family N-acetyltransferase n=1 Tax=Kribbella sp. CA-245084 TaxID=3239940 RepID=UPI003D8F62FE